jgi:hypothetical protein
MPEPHPGRYHPAMDERHRGREQPDEPVEDYENDADDVRESLEREAGLTAFGGPAFGRIFENPDDDGGFDARHNP